MGRMSTCCLSAADAIWYNFSAWLNRLEPSSGGDGGLAGGGDNGEFFEEDEVVELRILRLMSDFLSSSMSLSFCFSLSGVSFFCLCRFGVEGVFGWSWSSEEGGGLEPSSSDFNDILLSKTFWKDERVLPFAVIVDERSARSRKRWNGAVGAVSGWNSTPERDVGRAQDAERELTLIFGSASSLRCPRCLRDLPESI